MKFTLIALLVLVPASILYAGECPIINGHFKSSTGYEAQFETQYSCNEVTQYIMSINGRSPDRFRPDGKPADIDEKDHSAGTFTAVCRNGNEVVLDIKFLPPVELEFKEIYKLNPDGSVDLSGIFNSPVETVLTHFVLVVKK